MYLTSFGMIPTTSVHQNINMTYKNVNSESFNPIFRYKLTPVEMASDNFLYTCANPSSTKTSKLCWSVWSSPRFATKLFYVH
jgi:hypothetical protein